MPWFEVFLEAKLTERGMVILEAESKEQAEQLALQKASKQWRKYRHQKQKGAESVNVAKTQEFKW